MMRVVCSMLTKKIERFIIRTSVRWYILSSRQYLGESPLAQNQSKKER
jgi:hypothetical protein